ncbi:hypothetical protein [Salinilacihabitans rarus]|uniref:hypothetical protein n=1 Tax=Salinilacihabitans rarus TaxID=2961596 RepID=UPI0020C85004|nr:hypothetical protein [Salinilacihabitans rarus]
MDRPDEEPTEKPTNTAREAEEETAWLAQNWVGIAVVSILGLVVLVVGMMQWSGLVDVFAPVADTEGGQWAAFAALALVVLALGVWGWRSVAASQ